MKVSDYPYISPTLYTTLSVVLKSSDFIGATEIANRVKAAIETQYMTYTTTVKRIKEHIYYFSRIGVFKMHGQRGANNTVYSITPKYKNVVLELDRNLRSIWWFGLLQKEQSQVKGLAELRELINKTEDRGWDKSDLEWKSMSRRFRNINEDYGLRVYDFHYRTGDGNSVYYITSEGKRLLGTWDNVTEIVKKLGIDHRNIR